MGLADTERRLARIETELAGLRPSIAERITKPEAAASARMDDRPKSRVARRLAWLGAEAPKLIAAVVLLVVTQSIKDSVDLAIKRQQLQLVYTKEMQTHLEKMADPASDREPIEAPRC